LSIVTTAAAQAPRNARSRRRRRRSSGLTMLAVLVVERGAASGSFAALAAFLSVSDTDPAVRIGCS
jgi:hypothetical protein